MTNWIERENRFGLLAPPSWWLQQLAIFDPDLVLFPAASDAKYRLAQRVKNSYGLQIVSKLHHHPDTSFMADNRLVPVFSFLPTIQWTMEIFDMLRMMDMRPHGGANGTADLLDAVDRSRDDKIQTDFAGDVNDLSGAAYRAAKIRLGQRMFVNTNAPSQPSEHAAL